MLEFKRSGLLLKVYKLYLSDNSKKKKNQPEKPNQTNKRKKKPKPKKPNPERIHFLICEQLNKKITEVGKRAGVPDLSAVGGSALMYSLEACSVSNL